MFDVEFGLRADDTDLGAFIASLLAPFRVAGDVGSWYELVSIEGGGAHEVWRDDIQVLKMADEHLVGLVTWHLNQRVMLETRSHLVVHAGAASLGDRAVVLPGDPDAGKSTLTVALVSAGFAYLSDEAAAVDLATGLVCPYPRAIALERGRGPCFRTGATNCRATPHRGSLVGFARSNPARLVGRPCPARAVVFPHLEPGTPAELTPISRAESVRRLADDQPTSLTSASRVSSLSWPWSRVRRAGICTSTGWIMRSSN